MTIPIKALIVMSFFVLTISHAFLHIYHAKWDKTLYSAGYSLMSLSEYEDNILGWTIWIILNWLGVLGCLIIIVVNL